MKKISKSKAEREAFKAALALRLEEFHGLLSVSRRIYNQTHTRQPPGWVLINRERFKGREIVAR